MQLTQLKRTANQREAGQSSFVASAGRYRHFADATQLNSTEIGSFELCRYKRAWKYLHIVSYRTTAVTTEAKKIIA